MPFAELPSPSLPPHLRPEVVVPYTAPAGARNENDRYPDALYEYIWNAPERITGTTRVAHAGDGGQFVLIILPHPVRGLDLTSGRTLLVLAAILHEEVFSSEDGKPPLVTIDGWLSDSIEEAQENWRDYIEQESPLPPASWPSDATDLD